LRMRSFMQLIYETAGKGIKDEIQREDKNIKR